MNLGILDLITSNILKLIQWNNILFLIEDDNIRIRELSFNF